MLARASRQLAAGLILLAFGLAACRTREPQPASGAQQPASAARRQETAPAENVRSPGESAAQFAKHVIPPGNEPAFEPVELSCGPPGSSVVLLFRGAASASNYTGWVLYPSDGESARYRKAVLPPMDEAAGLFDITVKSVFAADATPAPALIVLYQYYRTGSGSDPHYASYVYRWVNGAFTVDSKASASLVGLDTERKVRSKLNTR